MKQIVAIVLIFITLFLTGCNPFDNGSTKYLTQKMDEIPLEFEGYEFTTTSSRQTESPRAFGQVTFGDTTIEIKKGYHTEEGSYRHEYYIESKDKTIYLNDEYMREKSPTYVQIHDIWRNWDKRPYPDSGPCESEVYRLFVYDNHLFVATNGLKSTWTIKVNVFGLMPVTLYMFDIETEKFYYAGYISDYTNPNPYLTIQKV